MGRHTTSFDMAFHSPSISKLLFFSGEPAVDVGGPLHEYFHLLLSSITHNNLLFAGDEANRVPTQCYGSRKAVVLLCWCSSGNVSCTWWDSLAAWSDHITFSNEAPTFARPFNSAARIRLFLIMSTPVITDLSEQSW
jgi:hypothetical protein